MERKEIFEKLNDVFNTVFDDMGAGGSLCDSTCSDDIEGWDSLAQIQLVSLIQTTFGVKFTAKEMLSWENVGNMVDSIQKKL